MDIHYYRLYSRIYTSEAARDAQISSTQLVLKKGGFGFKYVVYNGNEPGEKASSDGVHVKILRYKWDSEQDILYSGFTQLNLKKRFEARRKPTHYQL